MPAGRGIARGVVRGAGVDQPRGHLRRRRLAGTPKSEGSSKTRLLFSGGSSVHVIAAITDAPVARRSLDHVGISSRAPPLAAARDPSDLGDDLVDLADRDTDDR